MELRCEHFDFNRNLGQQRELFKDCFPETGGDPIQQSSHYMWKFHSFPNVPMSWEFASYFEEDMVGYYAALPYRYKIGEKITGVGMVCDVMTSSHYRGKGIFTKMGRYSTDELSTKVPFTMGYPIRKEVIPGHLKVGWKIPFSMPLYMKFLRSNALLESKKLSFLSPFANVILTIYNGVLQTCKTKNFISYMTDSINDVTGYEAFASKWNNSVKNALVKDLAFAKWRYSAPERKYRFLFVNDTTDKIVAFVAFRTIVKEGVLSYGLLDFMVLPGFEKSIGVVNRELSKLAKKEGVEAVMTMMSKHSASTYKMLRNGFLKSPFVFQLIIKNLTNEFQDSELFDEKNWHLMWVDSDDL
jgi:hypothetical protein